MPAGLFAMLAALTDTGPWAEADVHLFINDVDPGKGAVIGDFDEATFGGYAALTIGEYGEAYEDSQGNATRVAAMLQWDWDSGDAETVYGWYATINGTGELLAYGRLDAPKVMYDTSQSLILVPRVSVSGENMGSFVQVDSEV